MLPMGFSFKEMALEFLEGYCFEKHLKKTGGGGGWPLEPFLFS